MLRSESLSHLKLNFRLRKHIHWEWHRKEYKIGIWEGMWDELTSYFEEEKAIECL